MDFRGEIIKMADRPRRLVKGLYRHVTRTNVSFFDPVLISWSDERTEH